MAAVGAALFGAVPALADNGGTHIAGFMPAAPTIDGTLAVGEWDAATSYTTSFGTFAGKIYVGRDATNLYLAVQISDGGGTGSIGIWFDNGDNGTVDVGDDVIDLNTGAAARDRYIANPVGPGLQDDTFGGGTNDVAGAWGMVAGAALQVFEFRKPLCSSDSSHDFCFTQGKLGVAFFYGSAPNQFSGSSPANASITDQSTFAEIQFSALPTVQMTKITGNESLQLQSNGAYIVWFNNTAAGSFDLFVPQNDDPAGITSASWPSQVNDAINTSTAAQGWTVQPSFQSARDAKFTFASGAADTTSFTVTSTNGNGQTSAPRTVAFTHDGTPPSAGISCQPAGCGNASGPVVVTLTGSDNQSGIQTFHYTLDSTVAQPTWIDASPGSTVSVTTSATHFKLEAIDNVGNVGFATASISGVPGGGGGQAQTGPIFTVNTTADHADTAGCTTDDCTLREAIAAANLFGGAAQIAFALPTPNHTIAPTSQLPAITSDVYVNGLSQPGTVGGPGVVLDGSAIPVGVAADGLDLSSASGARVSGLVVENWRNIGINVISGSGQRIDHNWVGLDPTGVNAAANGHDGIHIQNVTGATVDDNVSSASENGIRLLNATNTTVQANTVGVNVSGTAARPNYIDGIGVDGGSGNQILGNYASGNTNQGISVFTFIAATATHDNVVENNKAGLTPSGAVIGNGGEGIRVDNGYANVIGAANAPNTVTGNHGRAGIAVYKAGSTGNSIRGNSVYGNDGLGIDLGGDGVTSNDTLDGDGGPNDLVNFPVLAPLATGTTLDVNGKLTAAPDTRYVIDVYANTSCDASGFGEGEKYLASVDVTTDAKGATPITTSLTPETMPAQLTLTATDAAKHETSEFSQCQKVGVAGTATSGTVALSQSSASSPAGASIVTLTAIPKDAFTTQPPQPAPIDSSPIDSSPIDSSPIDSSPIDSSPIDSSGLSSTNLVLNQLGGVPLSELPLLPPKTWSGVLGRDVQESTTTLASVITQIHSLDVGDIDWRHATTALATVGIGAWALGTAQLSNIRPLADWCTSINAIAGFANTCSTTTFATKTVMDIALQGIPIDSSGLGDTPIDSSNLSGTPIDSSPIDSSDLAGTPIDSSSLGAIDMSVSVLGRIPLAQVLAAGSTLGTIPTSSLPSGICSVCTATTLAGDTPASGVTVRALGSLLNRFTVHDLHLTDAMGVTFGNIGAGMPPSITINDLLRAYFGIIPFDPATLPLEGIQTVADAAGTSTVTYSVQVTLNGDATTGKGYAELLAAIDPSARYVPGSTSMSLNGNVIAGSNNDPGVSGGKLAWSLNGLTFGQTYTLSFKVYPGMQLGVDRTTVTLVPAGAASSSDSKDLTVTDTFEGTGGNNTPSTATAVSPGKLYISFEQTQNDTDWYSLPVPPAGTVSTFTLSHLANDKDILVLAPNGNQFRSAPIDSSPIDSSPIDSSPVLDPITSITQSTDALQPAAVQDVPIDSSQLASAVIAGVSDNAGTSDDSVSVVSNGASGNYLIHIVDSDPTPTSTPYVLDVEQTPPKPPIACPNNGVRTLPKAGQGSAVTAVSPSSNAAATTLVLADFKRYGDTYGSQAETNLQSKLATFATKVGALVVPVEGVQAVRDAYASWDANTCDPEAANGVVRAIINNVVTPFQSAHGNAKFLVIAGGDSIIPFPRVPDATTTSPERSYVGTIGYPKNANNAPVPTNNELVGSAAASYMETDDVWSAFTPSPFLTAPLYIPQWATGRLVEQPAEIEHQLDVFNTGGAQISPTPTTAFMAGYGFLADSANATSTALGAIATASNTSLVNDTWLKADLVNGLHLGSSSPQIVGINAHYDHYRALPAGKGDLFTTADVKAVSNAETARLIFSIGCHSGYSVPDELYAMAADPFALDWPQVDFQNSALARVANTTYGYGDTDTIGYSEQVEVDFAKRLSQMTLGEALLYAKQQYIADLGSVGPFEQKSANALTFYGLPMLRIGSGTTATAPTPAPTVTDPATGLPSVPVSSSLTFGSPQNAPSGGQYFQGPDGIDATNNRPFEPKKIVPDITEPGLLPHGFLITGLGVNAPISGFVAARSRAVPDSADLTPALESQVGWPSSLARISSFATPTGPRQQLVLLHGQFLSDPNSSSGAGTQTNFNQITGSVLYSTSLDGIPPQLSNIRVTAVPTGVAFEVDVTDATSVSDTSNSGTVKGVTVVYYEPATTPLAAHVIALTQTPGTNHWTGGGPLVGGVNTISYFMQAVDAAGNVGLSVHKVIAAPVVLQQSPGDSHLAISPAGPPPSGWFGGAQTVSISADAGYAVTYSVDGGVVRAYSAPFTVTGDGVHIVDAFADNGAGGHGHVVAAIPIDAAGPAITITVPLDGTFIFPGDTAQYICSDAGSGVASGSCVGTVPNGSPVPTTGTTFTVTAKDVLNHTATKTATYQVWSWSGFLQPVDNPPAVNVGTAGNGVPVKFSLGANRGLSFLASGYPASQKVACDPTAPLDTLETTVTAGQSTLSYDSTTNTYTYAWKTDKSWSGTCRDLTLKFINGDTRVARFKFK